jgi:hypothetical protein
MKRFIAALSACACILTLTGCKTITPQRVAAVARSAAYGGTKAALKDHPQLAPGFDKAHDDLMEIATSTRTNLDIIEVVQILQRFPVKQFQSDTATIIVQSTTLLLMGVDLPPIPADRVKDVQLISRAIAEGIALARGSPVQ